MYRGWNHSPTLRLDLTKTNSGTINAKKQSRAKLINSDMLIFLRAMNMTEITVTKLPMKTIAGITVSREPSPHPPKAPVIKDGTPVKFSQLLVLTSRKPTSRDLFQIATASHDARISVDKLISVLTFLLM